MHEELSQLDKMFEYLREKIPHVSVIYRTTIAGHENCDALFNQPPLAAIPKNEHIDPNYHWNDVRNRSLLFQELVKIKQASNILYSDSTLNLSIFTCSNLICNLNSLL